jgi:hypothetical protein
MMSAFHELEYIARAARRKMDDILAVDPENYRERFDDVGERHAAALGAVEAGVFCLDLEIKALERWLARHEEEAEAEPVNPDERPAYVNERPGYEGRDVA